MGYDAVEAKIRTALKNIGCEHVEIARGYLKESYKIFVMRKYCAPRVFSLRRENFLTNGKLQKDSFFLAKLREEIHNERNTFD